MAKISPAFFVETRKFYTHYGKVYQPVIGLGMPLRFRALRGMFRTASQAEAYGRRAAKKWNGLFGAAADNLH